MTLLATPDMLHARQLVARGALAPLAAGLRRELEPLLAGSRQVPVAKALLSRAGGRCDRDGTLLTYDPFDLRHRCPRCGRELTGELHDRFRIYWHQLWLAERAVHAALLGILLDDARCRDLAADLLDRYAAQYLHYPNEDNVLGPSRPFFSTYLESIWLLQLAVALDLLEGGAPSAGVAALGARVRDRLIAPSAALVASYDEGMSNRQVWNNAALVAAGTLLGDEAMVERALDGPSGLHAHLGRALLADGSWYEGENYHLFAHRGLWYAVQMAETLGRPLPDGPAARFAEGFAAPFRTVLPDLTYPSRRDSQYAVSVRQPRFAESCELGLARRDDDRLTGMLARLYDPSVPRRETGRAASTADVERNLSATALARTDLSWRALLLARPALPELRARPMTSDLLPAQGFAILRRDQGRSFVALDYGQSGGGHGHPDRLNLLLVDGDARWFDDPGTGSYVDPTLHWYRSTLAHTAPLVDGRSQPRVHGRLLAFHDAGAAGWISAEAELAPGLRVARTVVVVDDYLVDLLEWDGASPHEIALPLHGVDVVDERGAPLPRAAAEIRGGSAAEDGFGFLREARRIVMERDGVATLRSVDAVGLESGLLRGWLSSGAAAEWWSARAPDVPTRAGLAPLLLVRQTAARGRLLSVWSWRDSVAGVIERDGALEVARRDGRVDSHTPLATGWRLTMQRDGHATVIELGDAAASADAPPSSEEIDSIAPSPVHVEPHALPARFGLGAPHYRRSEAAWEGAGRPRAVVVLASAGPGVLTIEVDVPRSHRLFVPIDAENPLDNEPAAINGDGVQLYVEAGEVRAAWLLVPVAGSDRVGARPIEGWPAGLGLEARWHPTPGGWSLTAQVVLPAGARDVGLDLIVNETAPGRARRRGQLVLSGANGEFVYLRGDRHDPARLLRFIVPHV